MHLYKGLIHFHSYHSFDSILSIQNIVKFAIKNNLNFLILTDHNKISGAIELKKYIEKHKLNIEVICAAEYCTDLGDVIAIGIQKEITNMRFAEFVKEVRQQNGKILFPHPYVGHTSIPEIAEEADLIEVFNSRATEEQNINATKLAKEYQKPGYYAADAHNKLSLKRAIVSFEKNGCLIESLVKSPIIPLQTQKTYFFEILYSQYIKSIKNKNLTLFCGITKTLLLSIIKWRFFKPI